MRKWLLLLLAIVILFALPKFNTRGRRRSSPFLKRINDAINIIVVILLVVYFSAFLYWLWREVIR